MILFKNKTLWTEQNPQVHQIYMNDWRRKKNSSRKESSNKQRRKDRIRKQPFGNQHIEIIQERIINGYKKQQINVLIQRIKKNDVWIPPSNRICAFFNVKKINPLRLFQTQNYSLQTRRKSPKNYKNLSFEFQNPAISLTSTDHYLCFTDLTRI